jgi:hypothetical protein
VREVELIDSVYKDLVHGDIDAGTQLDGLRRIRVCVYSGTAATNVGISIEDSDVQWDLGLF